jgi:hypothetical protein
VYKSESQLNPGIRIHWFAFTNRLSRENFPPGTTQSTSQVNHCNHPELLECSEFLPIVRLIIATGTAGNMANNPNAIKTLTRAILEKRCVAIRCDGSARLITIEPHAIYLDRKRNMVLDHFQKSGKTNEKNAEGFWNTTGCRKINAVFWLNTFFRPRLKQGFVPEQEKYQKDLLAIVDTGKRSTMTDSAIVTIENSIDQLLSANPESLTKH